jgi:hypothetical protein
VWESVARYESAIAATATGSLVDHLDRLDSTQPPIRVRPVAGQRGVLLGVGGQPLTVDLFGSAGALRAHLPALIRAARLDAALVPPHLRQPVPGRRARRMARRLAGTALRRADVDTGDGPGSTRRTHTSMVSCQSMLC